MKKILTASIILSGLLPIAVLAQLQGVPVDTTVPSVQQVGFIVQDTLFGIRQIPEFLFILPGGPRIRGVLRPAGTETRTNIIERRIPGQCQVIPPRDPYCDIDGVVNADGLTFRLNWICQNLPSGNDCLITKNGKPFMEVRGTGFLDQIPIPSGQGVNLSITGQGFSLEGDVFTPATCADQWSSGTPTPTPTPSPICSFINSQTVTNRDLKFTDNSLVSGTFPRFRFKTNDDGKLQIKGSIGSLMGGPCLSPAFKIFLYDRGILKFGPLSVDQNWSGDFPSLVVGSEEIHDLEMKIVSNCTASVVQSLVELSHATLEVSGPLGQYCPIVNTVAVPKLVFTNNRLTTGSFPQYSFQAGGNRERVSVRVSVGGFSGASCLTPPYRVTLYNNGVPVFDPPVSPVNGTIGDWYWTFPDLVVEPGTFHNLQAGIATNCTSRVIQSVATLTDVSMTITRN